MKKEEIIEKYGDVKLKFIGYYKFNFSFKGETDAGETVYAAVGGCADEIYRLEIEAHREETIKTLEPNYMAIYRGKESIAAWHEQL